MFYKKLADKVRTARSEVSLSQTELAELLGVSQQTVSALEAGKRKLPVHLVIPLCQATGKTADYYLNSD